MFIQGNLLRTIGWELTSPMALRNCSKEISEEPGYIGVFVGERNVVKLQNTTVNYQKKYPTSQGLQCFFMYGKMEVTGLIEIIPLICILTIQGQCPLFLHSEFHLRGTVKTAAVTVGFMADSTLFTEIEGNIFFV